MDDFGNRFQTFINELQELEDYEIAELIRVFRGNYDTILPALRVLFRRAPNNGRMQGIIPFCINLCIDYSCHTVYHYIWDESARRFADIFL